MHFVTIWLPASGTCQPLELLEFIIKISATYENCSQNTIYRNCRRCTKRPDPPKATIPPPTSFTVSGDKFIAEISTGRNEAPKVALICKTMM
jgi:hypothetical protein